MKKLYLALCSILLWTSCIDNEKDFSVSAEQRIINCETAENYLVPIREGYTTYVTCGEDTLAVANEPIMIKIPKAYSAASTRGEGANPKIDYEVMKAGSGTYAAIWQAVMFEDTPNGDYDYNDLIIHVRNRMHIPYGKEYINQCIDIQPIALGGSKKIALGCLFSSGKEQILSRDVRADLFDNKKGFINTIEEENPIRYKLTETGLKDTIKHTIKGVAWIAWFIEVDGKRMYAANTDISYKSYDMANQENMPYGIVVFSGSNDKHKANGTFFYPKEKISLYQAYPNFQKWINGESSSIGLEDNAMIYKYSRTEIEGKDGKKYRIWDWLDLE